MGGILLVSPGIEDGLKARCSLGKPQEGPTHPWTHLLTLAHSSVQVGTDTTSAATCTKRGI